MAFFQSNFAIRQRSKHNSAAFGPEVASDIVFRTAHTGNRLVTFTVSEGNDSARVHSSAGAALVARVSHRGSDAELQRAKSSEQDDPHTLYRNVISWGLLLDRSARFVHMGSRNNPGNSTCSFAAKVRGSLSIRFLPRPVRRSSGCRRRKGQ